MMNYNLSLNLALEALEYIKKNNPSFFHAMDFNLNDKDYISKVQLSLVDIRDNCKVVKNLPIMLDNR